MAKLELEKPKKRTKKEIEEQVFYRICEYLNKYPKNVLVSYIANISDLAYGSTSEFAIYQSNREMFDALDDLNKTLNKSRKQSFRKRLKL